MEDIDDDFSDLYADVEFQASSSINVIQTFTQLRVENDINQNENDNNVDFIGDDETKEVLSSEANGEKEGIVDNGSDSEDDFNIVLNDDDDGGLKFAVNRNGVNLRSGGNDDDEFQVEEDNDGSAGGEERSGLGKNRKWGDQAQGQVGDGLEQSSNGGERGNGGKVGYHSPHAQYKYTRSHPTAFSNNSKANGSAGLALNSLTSVKGDREDNGCSQLMGPNSMAAQNRHNFSLPRSRTILDVNIDSFERKPWRHPGADITNFFNFGFSEDSWKHYCNRLQDQHRQQNIMLSSFPTLESLKPNELYEARYGSEMAAQEAMLEKGARSGQGRKVSYASKISCREQQQSEVPKGRAIQVEDSIGERQPSMDVRRPLNRDSDVIQITVQDSKEDCSGSAKEGLGCIDSSVQEAPENGDFGVNDVRDILHFSSASEDELPLEDVEGHDEGLDSPVPKRCSERSTTCPLSVDSDNHESVQISDVDGHDHEDLAVCDSERTSEVMETSNDTKKRVHRDTSNTSPSILETESSRGERSQRSPSSSYSGNHCEEFKDGAAIDPKKYDNLIKRSSPNSVTELRKLMASDHYHLKYSKTHGVKIKPGDCKYSTRNRSPVQEDLKHCNDGHASPVSDTDGFLDVNHPTVGHGRQKERLHDFDSYDGEDVYYFRESELSFHNYGRRFCEYQGGAAYTKKSQWNDHQTFGDETKRYVSRDSDKGEYFLERGLSRGNHEVVERNWCHYGRRLAVQELGPFNCEDSRRLISDRSSYVDSERGTRWRRKGDELHFRKRMKHDDYLFEYRYDNEYMQERYKRSVPSNDRDRDYSVHKSERHTPYSRREVKSPGRNKRRFDSLSVGLDNMLSTGHVDEYRRCMANRSLSSRSYKESRTTNDKMWYGKMSPRNEVIERHEGHRRQIWSERHRDGGWFGSYADAFDIDASTNNPDDWVHVGRRRHQWQSEGLHWTEAEYVSRHRDDKSYGEGASFTFERTSRRKGFDVKHGSDHVGKLMGDKQFVQGRCKLIREGNSGNRYDRSSNIIDRSNHEQIRLRCGNSAASYLVGGEGKFSGRCSKAGTVVYNGWHGNMDWNTDPTQEAFKDFNESHAEKVDQAGNLEVETNKNDKTGLDKYPGIQQNVATDIEEGQIITAEINANQGATTYASVDVVHISDVMKLHNENATDGNVVVQGCDNPRILEVRAKMEKRRERFKEPIPPKKETEKIPHLVVQSFVETAETRQQRPARKRRWGGS